MPNARRFCRCYMLCGSLVAPFAVGGQGMDHSRMAAASAPAQAAAPSQAAFATIQEIVRRLKADPATDWSKVNIEALRQHLIDMDDVVMRSSVRQSNVDGGVTLDITGDGKVAAAIKRMGVAHAAALTADGEYAAKADEIANGVRLVVTAANPDDPRAVTRIRGLGFAGLLTESDHHSAHHLALAKGESMEAGHRHKP